MISFVNSKDDCPIYNICIFTYLNIIHIYIYKISSTCLPNSKAYPKKRQPGSARSIYWTYPFTGRIFSAAGSIHWRYNSWAKEAGVKKTQRLHPDFRRRQSKTAKPCPEPPMVWLAKKNWRKSGRWNVSTTTIRVRWFQIFCFECSTRSTLGKWSYI